MTPLGLRGLDQETTAEPLVSPDTEKSGGALGTAGGRLERCKAHQFLTVLVCHDHHPSKGTPTLRVENLGREI